MKNVNLLIKEIKYNIVVFYSSVSGMLKDIHLFISK